MTHISEQGSTIPIDANILIKYMLIFSDLTETISDDFLF